MQVVNIRRKCAITLIAKEDTAAYKKAGPSGIGTAVDERQLPN
jgi:hypothetical protein